MVIAGPGTGKTQILTLRIANILRLTDTPPSGILALTFTEAGVYAMRKRLVAMVGSRGYQVAIYTFHSFCNDLIRRFPDAYPRIIGAQLLTEVDKLELLKALIDEAPLKRLRPFGSPYHYLPHVARAISDLKKEAISPEEAARRAREEREAFASIEDLYHEKGPHKGKKKGKYVVWEAKLEKNEDLAQLYARYEQRLREERRYDFDDMIVETVAALERNEDFLLSVQEEYLYLLADEHQDANQSQNRILELLASFHPRPNLFLVGDAKQAIYRFQGASLENFLYFQKKYPEAEVIRLSDNYRSRQFILDSSFSMIAKGGLAEVELKEPLKAHLEETGEKITVASFSEPAFEAAYVARAVRDLIDQGVPAEEIAVLYRNNRDVEQFIPDFERLGVPFVVESDQNVLADPLLRGFVSLLRTLVHYGNEELLASFLCWEVTGLAPLDIYKLMRLRRDSGKSLYGLLAQPALLEKAGVGDSARMAELGNALARWSRLARNRGVLEVLDTVAQESGFVRHLLTLGDGRERLEFFRSFLRDIQSLLEAHRDYGMAEVVRYLSLLEEHRVPVKSVRPRVRTPSVRCMTAHKAKGLEFDYVFLVQAYDAHWGGAARPAAHFTLTTGLSEDAAESAIDDERRLFYVALTRARHGVTITYATRSLSGRPQLPCRFIEEIDPRYREEVAGDAFEQNLDPALLLAPRQARIVSPIDEEYLRALFLEQGLSVTALNNFLKNPWEYFFANLLRVPLSPNRHMLFGDAVHQALRDHYERLRTGERADGAYLLDRFRYHLSRKPLSAREWEEMRKKGEESLARYWEARCAAVPRVFATELSLTAQFQHPEGFSFPLRGMLDRVDLVEEGGVRVVDYKTGKPKSRNHIEGRTKAQGAGDYYRQLVFYRLLWQRAHRNEPAMAHAAIEFVEPDARGVVRTPYVASITDEEVARLEEEIAAAARRIYHLEFLRDPCDARTTSFCPLVRELFERKESREA